MAWFDDVFGDPDLVTGDYAVTRTPAPEFFDGVEFPGVQATLQTGASSLQPAGGAQLKVLPEGLRADNAAQLWTRVQLVVEPIPDVVTVTGHPNATWNGPWRVYQVTPWVGHGSQHWIAYLSRVV